MMSAAQGMPTSLETWAQRLQQVGTTLAGAGSVGSSPMGNSYASSMPSASQNSMMMQDYNGFGGGAGGGFADFAGEIG
jgi:hypothetical protein